MKKFIMTLLILGAVVGVVAMIMRRRGSDMDEWRSFAEEPPAEAAKDAADDVTS